MPSKPLIYWVSMPTEVEYDMDILSKLTKKMTLRVCTVGTPDVSHPYGIDISFKPYYRCDGDGANQQDIFSRIVADKPDLVIKKGGWAASQSGQLGLFPSIMRANNIRHCLWTSEQGVCRDWQMDVARFYEYIVVNNTPDYHLYQRTFSGGIHKIGYMPFGCIPDYHKPIPMRRASLMCSYTNPQWGIPEKSASFMRIVGALIEEYTPKELALYGKDKWYMGPFENWHRGEFPYKDFVKANNSVDILLGVTANAVHGGYGCKLAKMLACGKMVLWDYTTGMEFDFKNKYHLVWTKSADETKKLVKYYLHHPRERNQIARNGRKFACEHLSWEKNILGLLEWIKAYDRT